jgi:cytochrome P450
MQNAGSAGETVATPVRIDTASRRVSLNPNDSAFYQDPYPSYEAIRKETPIFFWEEFGHWGVLNIEDVIAITRDKRFGREILHVATREELGLPPVPNHLRPYYEMDRLNILQREPPNHTRLRQIMARAFVPRQIERIRQRVEIMADEAIDSFESQGSVDLLPSYTMPIPAFVIAELLGLPASTVPSILDWTHRISIIYQHRRPADKVASAMAATLEFQAFLADFIKFRRENPSEDLLGTMVAAVDSGELDSEAELMANCVFILGAGHETTVHTMGSAIWQILESGEAPDALLGTPEAAEATIEECIRLHPPVHVGERYVLEDLDYRGVALKKGQRVLLVIGAANRDPARFADAQRFDPGRPRQPHTTFGGGIHVCLGAALARLEMQVAMTHLFRRLPGLHLVDTPRYSDTFRFHALESLNVAW